MTIFRSTYRTGIWAAALAALLAGATPVAGQEARLPEIELTPVDLTNCQLGAEVLTKGNALAAGLLIEDCLSQKVSDETRGKYLAIKGAADLKLKLYELALRDFDGALAVREADAELLSGKGESLLGLQRGNDAVAVFREAITLEPGNARALTGLGRSYLQDSNVALANAFLTKAVDVDPTNATARMARGTAWFDQGEFALAENDFSAVIGADGQAFDAFHKRGQARMHLKAYEGALADYDAAKALNNDNEELRLDRVLALAQLGRTSDAQLELNEVIEMAPNNVKALMMRGRLYLALENTDKAMADFTQAATIDPSGPYADEAMAQLNDHNRMDWSDYSDH